MALRHIEMTVKTCRKNEIQTLANDKNLMHNKINNERGGHYNGQQSTASNDQDRRANGGNLDIGERLLHSGMGSESRGGGGTESDNNVYENEKQISGQTHLRKNDDEQNTGTAFDRIV